MLFHLRDLQGLVLPSTRLPINDGIVTAISARCNGDSLSDVIVLTPPPSPELRVFNSRPGGNYLHRWTASLPSGFDQVTAHDITGDRKVDLILHDRTIPGALVYRGNGDGSFRSPVPLFPEIYFGSFRCEDVNSDEIIDIVATNWVTNEVMVFTGFGKLKYGAPSIIAVEGEPIDAQPCGLSPGPWKDLIIGTSDSHLLTAVSGDGLGNFHSSQTIRLPFPVSGYRVGDMNADGKVDVICLSAGAGSLSIFLNDGSGKLESNPIDISAGISTASFLLLKSVGGTPAADTLTAEVATLRPVFDVAVLDSSASRVLVFVNDHTGMPISPAASYVTGRSPVGISTSDLNADGWEDMVVANGASQSLSVYFNRGDGSFRGQISVSLPAAPTSLAHLEVSGFKSHVITVSDHPYGMIATRFDSRDMSGTSLVIPTESLPDVISATSGGKSAFQEIVAVHPRDWGDSRAITLYESSASGRYVEKDLTPSFRILTACGVKLHKKAEAFIAGVGYIARRKKVGVVQISAEKTGSRNRAMAMFDYPADTVESAILWSEDLNNDLRSDLVMNLNGKSHSLVSVMRTGDTTFTKFGRALNDRIMIASRNHLKLVDLNADGKKDIVFENALRKSIQAYLGKGDGTFTTKIRLTSSKDISAFTVCDIRKDGIPELVVVDKLAGAVRIISLED